MSQTTNETAPEKKTPWFKSAALPWTIIGLILAFALGNINGWFIHASAQADAHRAAVVDQQSKAQ